MSSANTPSPPPELSSWKQIAAYLGVSLKTAQVWERDRGLPVHRLPGPRAQVRAVVSELDAWKASPRNIAPEPAPAAQPIPFERPRTGRWRWTMLVAGVLFAMAAVALGVVTHQPELASVGVSGDALVGYNTAGKLLWRHDFGSLRADAYDDGEQRSWVGDLNADGRREVLFVPMPAGLVGSSVPLVCLDGTGKERWRFDPGKPVRRKDKLLNPPFVVRQFALVGNKVVVTSHHHLYYPTQVAVLSPEGKLLREYWHPGQLNVLKIGTYQGKPVAFLGGVNNIRHAATLVVLDPERLTGSAIEGDHPAFEGMAQPVEIARILFPRSAISPADPYNVVFQLYPQNDRLIADVHERLTGIHPPSIQYHLDQRLELTQVVLSDVFRSEYAQQSGHAVTPTEVGALHSLTRIR